MDPRTLQGESLAKKENANNMFRYRRCATMLGLAVMLFASVSASFAQQVFGSIYGTVTDANGGGVPNAKVTITDQNKGTVIDIVTDASGNYNRGQLIPDAYKVTVEAPGFSKVTSDVITVQVDEAQKYDVGLKVGAVTTEVEVSAEAPLLQADRADVAQTFTAKEVNDLPNIGRNLQSMELLNPGTAKLGWQHASDENPQNSVQLIANGQLFDAIGYELDGTTDQDPILGIIVINPNIDGVQEVKQAEQNFDAEFSYVGGGVISYSTRSGTNQFHADGFETLQLNTPGFTTFAANPFSGLPAATYRQNQFGGAIGGRIIKNKLFFFGDAQLNRQSQGASVVTTVPDALDSTGNFSEWSAVNKNYTIFDPNTGDPSTGVGRTAYANNTIPASEISPQALAIMKYFPAPNFQQIAGEPFVNNYAINGAVAITGNAFDTREDYYLNEKNTIFGRYSYYAYTEQAPGAFGSEAGGPAFGNYAGDSQALNQSIALGWTTTLSPTLINEFRFGYMRYHVFDVPNGYGTDPATAAGIPGLNLDKTYTSGLPYFNINVPTGDGLDLGYALGANQCNCPLTETETQYQFVDNLSKTAGKHTFKFGADLRYAENLRVPSDSHRAGELTFGDGETGSVSAVGANATDGVGLATFLLGDTTYFQRYVSSSTNAQEHQRRFLWYGQDEWRPTPKLTVTLGLRWEMIFPESVNGAGNGATLNLNDGLMYVFGVGGVPLSGIQAENWKTYAPRAGVAYQINHKTVIRAGYGWGYDLGVFGSTFGHNVTQNPPVLSNQQLNAVGNFTDVFNLAQGPPAPAGYTVSANGTFPLPNGIDPKFRPDHQTLPVTYLYNLSLQYQLTNRIALTAAYVGNANRHGFLGTGNSYSLNTPDYVPGENNNQERPYYAKYGWTQDISYYGDDANEEYNSFQAQFKVNNLAGWTLQGSYTYQEQWGDGWGPDANYTFLYDRSFGQGYSNTLPRQQWTLAQIYQIPYGRGQKYGSSLNRPLDALIGGWQISGVMTYYSGFPFMPSLENYGTDANGNPVLIPNAGPTGVPNIGNVSPYAGAPGNRSGWITGLSSGAYTLPAAGTFGNYPINTLFGPQFIQQDLSLSKTFKVTERLNFTFKTEARNAFNHTNLGLPNSDIQSSTVGLITGLAGGANMRSLQFDGAFHF
jgi:hypothetical protein